MMASLQQLLASHFTLESGLPTRTVPAAKDVQLEDGVM